ncbi:D-sedoheptulose-7-phosphate isomerase [Candidatus Pelagibacter communis]|jgi:D-sedoheptulose 7-phosphate isomerase|uniref:D-sedoheptulose-7-phosphate isomerase n=1 Tax=Pelagibacter ubique TaxID=198252 RepID=UPI00041F28AC|nr:SIS domain-containing protein [Candidatus Pelagibacter ubique]
MNFYKNYFEDSANVIKSLTKEEKKIKLILKNITNSIKNNKKIIVAGNGGSSSDADHFVGELVCTYKNKLRKSIPAISLSSNSAIITAWSNDFNFSTVYERQLSSLGTKGDILILLSTSGGNKKKNQSINLINAAIKAKKIGIKTISLLGNKGGDLKKVSDISLIIDSNKTSHIQEAHISILHYMCEELELL